MVANTQLLYLAIPVGEPVPGKTTKRVTTELDLDHTEGVVVKNLALSLDPYMRGRMRDPSIASYAAAYELGKPVQGFAVGEIIKSNSPKFKVGQHLYGFWDFGTYSVVPEALLNFARIVENKENLKWTTLVGASGMSGQTAWWSFYNIGKPKKGETIFISAAAGAVGQIVGQLAKREGLKVMGSAGSDDKVNFLKSELGFDVVWNYKKEDTLKILGANPIDIYFDNVGGETLDHAIASMNDYGRIIACGAVSQYNLPPDQRYRLKNYAMIVGKQILYQGFIITGKNLDDFFDTMPRLIASGDIKVREQVYQGLDDGEALVEMLSGKAQGKAVISMV